MQRSLAGSLLQLLIVIALLLSKTAAAATPSRQVDVSTEIELQQALQQPQVSYVVLRSSIQFQPDTWRRDGGGNNPAFVLQRNLTISSQPPANRLDFAFLGTNWLKLASGVHLNLSNLVLEHSRYGVGVQLDFVAPSAGAVVILTNVVVLRQLCVNSTDEPAAVAVMPRLPAFPGEQKAHYETNACAAGVCVPKMLVYDDFTKLSTFTADTAAGGYSLVFKNTTKLCMGWANHCTSSAVPDSCLQRALDDLPGTPPTPGRLAAAAEDPGFDRRRKVVVPAVVASVVGAAVVLALMLVLLRRSWRRLWWPGGGDADVSVVARKQPPRAVAAARGAPGEPHEKHNSDTASYLGKGVEVVVQPDSPAASASASSHSRPLSLLNGAAAAAVQQDLLCMQDNWELAAWKTSSHSLKRLQGPQQQQQQLPQHGAASDVVTAIDGASQLGGSVSISPFASKELSSHELILQGTGASTSQAVMAANKISLGLCIGAGAFGKVYKAKWRGQEVAVKVVQHSSAAAASVANEIDLMMTLQHPNLVSAFHFVTWRRRREGLDGGHRQHSSSSGDQQVLPFVRQGSHSSGSPSGSSAMAATATARRSTETDGPEDTQTWIVQEYCDAGNLGDYAIIHGDRQPGQLPLGHEMLRLLFRLREVADGMQYLHGTARVVHGDLKSSNILLCVSPSSPYGRTAKIADFGLARMYAAGETHKSTRTLGTINHMAPELLRFGKASAAADVYSFGIMMWELLTGEAAFQGWQWGAIIENVALNGQRPTIPATAPEDYCLLVESCWHQSPAQRPNFDEVLRCIHLMITSRQQELIEQAAQQDQQHTTVQQQPLLLSATSIGARCEDSSQSQHGTTTERLNHMTVDAAAGGGGVVSSTSSNGEFEMLRVGSMRGMSGSSNATYSSSALAALTSQSTSAARTSAGWLLPKPAGQAAPGSPVLRGDKAQPQLQRKRSNLQQQSEHGLQPQPSAFAKVAGAAQQGCHNPMLVRTASDDLFGPQDL